MAALAAPASAGPAAEVTRDRPWAALDWTFWAASLVASAAFFACAEAASVLWKRRAAKRRFCLRRGRATTADDIVCVDVVITGADSSFGVGPGCGLRKAGSIGGREEGQPGGRGRKECFRRGCGTGWGRRVGLKGRGDGGLSAQLLDYRPPCCRLGIRAGRGACCENSNGARNRTGCRPWRIRGVQFGAAVGLLAT